MVTGRQVLPPDFTLPASGLAGAGVPLLPAVVLPALPVAIRAACLRVAAEADSRAFSRALAALVGRRFGDIVLGLAQFLRALVGETLHLRGIEGRAGGSRLVLSAVRLVSV